MTESKFQKFFDFLGDYMIFPLTLAFITVIFSFGSMIILGTEPMWTVWIAFTFSAIAGVWLVLFLVCMVISKIIEHREDKMYEQCQTCDHYIDESCDNCCGNFENGCKIHGDCCNYQHILIEKDESEE